MPMTPTDADCEGLRLYRERCSDLFPDSVRGHTWYDQRDWVMENVSQDSLVEIFVQLMKDLTPISQANDGTPKAVWGTTSATLPMSCGTPWTRRPPRALMRWWPPSTGGSNNDCRQASRPV